MGWNADIATWVLASLRDHPHDDTPARLAVLLEAPVADVVEVLGALREAGLAHCSEDHWQLTTGGWRAVREPAASGRRERRARGAAVIGARAGSIRSWRRSSPSTPPRPRRRRSRATSPASWATASRACPRASISGFPRAT